MMHMKFLHSCFLSSSLNTSTLYDLFFLFLCSDVSTFWLDITKISEYFPSTYVLLRFPLYKHLCWISFAVHKLNMSRKPSLAVEYLHPSPQHQPKASEMNWILLHFEYVQLLCVKSHHLQDLETLILCASGFCSRYQLRQVTVEAEVPLQQLSTHQMSTSWMKVCCNAFCNVESVFGENITNIQ